MIEKTVPLDQQGQQRSIWPDINAFYGPDGRMSWAAHVHKGCKIMCTEKMTGCGLHGKYINRRMDVAHTVPGQSRPAGMQPVSIGVDLADGVEAGMKVIRHHCGS